MRDNKIKRIASHTGLSVATVKRALGNYYGINPATKAQVLECARQLGLEFKLKPVDVAIIMPGRPAFFWKPLNQHLVNYVAQTGLTYKFYLYSDSNNEQDAEHCIDMATRAGASVMILSAPSTELIKEKVRNISDKMFIILLEEWIDIEDTCFVGENSYQEGYDVADRYLKIAPESKVFLDVICTVGDPRPRTQGFFQRLQEAGISDFSQIDLEVHHGLKMGSAITARKLAPYIHKVDCIYCPSGSSDLVLMALGKLPTEHPVDLIYFENRPIKNLSTAFRGRKFSVNQDLEGQAKTAISLAKDYIETGKKPSEHCIYVPSQYI